MNTRNDKNNGNNSNSNNDENNSSISSIYVSICDMYGLKHGFSVCELRLSICFAAFKLLQHMCQ